MTLLKLGLNQNTWGVKIDLIVKIMGIMNDNELNRTIIGTYIYIGVKFLGLYSNFKWDTQIEMGHVHHGYEPTISYLGWERFKQ